MFAISPHVNVPIVCPVPIMLYVKMKSFAFAKHFQKRILLRKLFKHYLKLGIFILIAFLCRRNRDVKLKRFYRLPEKNLIFNEEMLWT